MTKIILSIAEGAIHSVKIIGAIATFFGACAIVYLLITIFTRSAGVNL